MDYRPLGRTGLRVSNIALGTMTFGRWIDRGASKAVLDAALDAGVNVIDTADVYGRGQDSGRFEELGEAESLLGELLGPRRERLIVTTKGWFPMYDGPNGGGLSRSHLIEAVEDSLRRLRIDHIDLYQLHNPDPATDPAIVLATMDELVRAGKIRYYGVSNHSAWQVAEAQALAAARGWEPVSSAQLQYSILWQQPAREMLDYAAARRLGVLVYSPLARGMLAGKYSAGQAPPQGSRAAAGERPLDALMRPSNHAIVDGLREVATAAGLSMPQLALAWVLSDEAVSCAIVGASRPEQLSELLSGRRQTLEQHELSAIEELCAR